MRGSDGSTTDECRQHPQAPRDTQDTQDRQIDAALALLRHAAPAEDLEQRVRQRVAAAALQRPGFRAWNWPWAAIGLVPAALLVMLVATMHRRVQGDAPRPHVLTASHSPQTQLMATATQGSPTHVDEPVDPAHRHGSERRRSVAAVAPVPLSPHLDRSEEEQDRPAPELPLTAQERLLLRIAHGDRPQQMAANRRVILPNAPAELTADFDTFFEPSTLPLTQGDPQ